MEPTETELGAINTLEEAYNWAGVEEDVRGNLNAELGNPTLIRDIVFVPRTTWDTVVGRTRGLHPDVGEVLVLDHLGTYRQSTLQG